MFLGIGIMQKVLLFPSVLLLAFSLASLLGCSSRPELQNVSAAAQIKPINTREQSQLIRQKNEQ
jgi:hypothetical protein